MWSARDCTRRPTEGVHLRAQLELSVAATSWLGSPAIGPGTMVEAKVTVTRMHCGGRALQRELKMSDGSAVSVQVPRRRILPASSA